ncbi:MAG TPA: hypothetical protein PLV92_26880, partial [Pirellulaceae bacterium]|nr:hypothetical protein [Pirellulaceae bacterium]
AGVGIVGGGLGDGRTGARFGDDPRRVTLQYVDGARGDDDGRVNGSILDPVAIVTMTESARVPAVRLDVTTPADENADAMISGVVDDFDSLVSQLDTAIDFGDDSPLVPLMLDSAGRFTVAHRYPDNGDYVVVVEAHDEAGRTGATSATQSIHNVGPGLTIDGPAAAEAGTNATFTFAATDVEADLAGGMTFRIDWDGDGAIDETRSGGASLTASHAFSAAGDFEVRATAVDKDGGVSAAATHRITVRNGSFVPGTVERIGTTLRIVGTVGADQIVGRANSDGRSLAVRLNGVAKGNFRALERLEVFGLDGGDAILVLGAVRLPVVLDGGAGDDELQGGDGDDLLLGGDGDDVLTATAGNDRLEGGPGSDRLSAGAGDDLLLGGVGDDELRGWRG